MGAAGNLKTGGRAEVRYNQTFSWHPRGKILFFMAVVRTSLCASFGLACGGRSDAMLWW